MEGWHLAWCFRLTLIIGSNPRLQGCHRWGFRLVLLIQLPSLGAAASVLVFQAGTGDEIARRGGILSEYFRLVQILASLSAWEGMPVMYMHLFW